MTTCRCGWNGEGEHLCHRCGKQPGQRRLIAYVASLAGTQPKLGAYETWGCEPCFEEYRRALEGSKAAGRTPDKPR